MRMSNGVEMGGEGVKLQVAEAGRHAKRAGVYPGILETLSSYISQLRPHWGMKKSTPTPACSGESTPSFDNASLVPKKV